jgi:hypothetical protein
MQEREVDMVVTARRQFMPNELRRTVHSLTAFQRRGPKNTLSGRRRHLKPHQGGIK